MYSNHVNLFSKVPSIKNRSAYYKERKTIKKISMFDRSEKLELPEVGGVEAFNDGLLPHVLDSDPFKKIPNVFQKTIRREGYFSFCKGLNDLGLLDTYHDTQTIRVVENYFKKKEFVENTAIVHCRSIQKKSTKMIQATLHSNSYQLKNSLLELTVITAWYFISICLKKRIEPGFYFPHELVSSEKENFLSFLVDNGVSIDEH